MLFFPQYQKQFKSDFRKGNKWYQEGTGCNKSEGKELWKRNNESRKQKNERENVIRNIYSKLEEVNEQVDVLEKKVKYTVEKHEYLETKIEKIKKVCKNSSIEYPCDLCELIFQTESKLEEHKGNEHTNKDGNNVNSESETPANAQIDDDSATQVKETEKEDKVFECDICTYKTKSANGIKIHKAKQHTYTCRDCDKTFPDVVAFANHSLDCYKPYNCHSPTQPKLSSTRVGLTTLLLSYPPPTPPHHKLLRDFQATQEGDFRRVTLIWPN